MEEEFKLQFLSSRGTLALENYPFVHSSIYPRYPEGCLKEYRNDRVEIPWHLKQFGSSFS